MQNILKRCRLVCYLLILAIVMEGIPLAAVQAQEKLEVRNVRFEVVDNTVIIDYDLQGPAKGEYKVTVVLKRQDSSFEYLPLKVIGDVGEVAGGGSKKITWNILTEISQGLEGEDYYFRVRVELIPQTSHTWLYIAGGAVIAGGTAALLLLGSSPKGGSVTNQEYPLPPGRPASY